MAMCLLVATVSLSLISPDAPGASKGAASLSNCRSSIDCQV